MKIVVVGLGKVGRALTQQLSADKHDIVVIDRNPTVVDDICNICDVRGVTGNGGCYEVQAEAFEGGADLLIAATDSDEINILACLVAKKLNTRQTIARGYLRSGARGCSRRCAALPERRDRRQDRHGRHSRHGARDRPRAALPQCAQAGTVQQAAL